MCKFIPTNSCVKEQMDARTQLKITNLSEKNESRMQKIVQERNIIYSYVILCSLNVVYVRRIIPQQYNSPSSCIFVQKKSPK